MEILLDPQLWISLLTDAGGPAFGNRRSLCPYLLNFFEFNADTSYRRRATSSFGSKEAPMGIRILRILKIFLGSLVVGLSALGCAHTVVVEIPPKIDLQPYKTIGIVEFTSNSDEKLNQIATQKFMGSIQNAQPNLRFLELGPEDQLVNKLGRNSMDIEAIKAIEKKYGVSSIFTGSFQISDIAPKVDIGTNLSSLRASAVVNVSMVSKHWDTVSGATIWSNSRQGHWKVAGINSTSKDISFSMTNPEDQYGRYLEELAFAVTDNFRPHYEKRNAPK
ncbi:MAG: hypothetical protein NCA08_05695 [Deltaproteobacteria bacterium]|nr:hypothetical protein [Candidatus Deferrimicrobium borealis]